jgi:hypothetical protein
MTKDEEQVLLATAEARVMLAREAYEAYSRACVNYTRADARLGELVPRFPDREVLRCYESWDWRELREALCELRQEGRLVDLPAGER